MAISKTPTFNILVIGCFITVPLTEMVVAMFTIIRLLGDVMATQSDARYVYVTTEGLYTTEQKYCSSG